MRYLSLMIGTMTSVSCLTPAVGGVAALPTRPLPEARVESGVLSGLSEGSVHAFLGIPYAAPRPRPIHAPKTGCCTGSNESTWSWVLWRPAQPDPLRSAPSSGRSMAVRTMQEAADICAVAGVALGNGAAMGKRR
jgi:hypothetical protein